MIGFLLPKYIKEGREIAKAAQKLLNYRRDLLSPEETASLEETIATLHRALKARNPEEVARTTQALDTAFAKHYPPQGSAFLRENTEVLVVAIVIALGVRTYFLQPFTIPTGSMQPTLNGVLAYKTEEPAPNPLIRTLHMALYGRSYVDAVSKQDDMVIALRPAKRFAVFNYTLIECKHQRFLVHAPPEKVAVDFGVVPGRPLKAGEVVARGYVNTGDHVFVDKLTYQLRKPVRGEVFVFNTMGIPTNENRTNPGGPSQFYIKRLAGTPGDNLRIVPPILEVDGAPATAPGLARVGAAKDGYRGYSNTANGIPFRYLGSPEQPFRIPPQTYFALGDNSYHSSDSRDWGIVPEKNLVGRGFFVYWPFTSHWGLIR